MRWWPRSPGRRESSVRSGPTMRTCSSSRSSRRAGRRPLTWCSRRTRPRSTCCRRSICLPRCPHRRWPTSRPGSDSPRGDWAGVSARVSVLVYNTRDVPRSKLPTSVMQLAGPQWSGKLAIAPGETDFQPVVTSIADAYGQRAALRWLRAIKANAAGPRIPGQRDDHRRRELGPGTDRDHQPLLLVPAQVRDRRGEHALGDRAFRGRAIPATYSTSPARRYLPRAGIGSAAQRFVAFLVSKQGQQIIARGDSFEYPLGSGRTHEPAASSHSASCARTPPVSPPWATGRWH